MSGDADGNGMINFDDYARIDTGFNNGINGWANGDFNYDGVVNFDDYSLIDLAFNCQGGNALPRSAPVPEPTSALMLALLVAPLARRMRRAQHDER